MGGVGVAGPLSSMNPHILYPNVNEKRTGFSKSAVA